jgi:hypothetical protein
MVTPKDTLQGVNPDEDAAASGSEEIVGGLRVTFHWGM